MVVIHAAFVASLAVSALNGTSRCAELGRFRNPPQFLPLAWFDEAHVAYVAWCVVMLIALCGCAALLFREDGLAAIALLLAMEPAIRTIEVAQTTFVVLLCALAWWLAIGVVLKPILAIVLLDALLRRRWKSLVSFAAAFAVLTIASIAAFGIGVHLLYLALRMPREVFTAPANRSLVGVLLRHGAPLWLLALVAIPVAAVVMRVRDDERLTFAALIAAALLLYRQTLDSYGILLMIPILTIWRAGAWAASAAARRAYSRLATPARPPSRRRGRRASSHWARSCSCKRAVGLRQNGESLGPRGGGEIVIERDEREICRNTFSRNERGRELDGIAGAEVMARQELDRCCDDRVYVADLEPRRREHREAFVR